MAFAVDSPIPELPPKIMHVTGLIIAPFLMRVCSYLFSVSHFCPVIAAEYVSQRVLSKCLGHAFAFFRAGLIISLQIINLMKSEYSF
jgi:hypothetical protein